MISFTSGNKKFYQANIKHPLFSDLNNVLLKYTGIDVIVGKIVSSIEQIEKIFLCGELAQGKDCDRIEIIFVGKNIDKNYLEIMIRKVEKLVNKKIHHVVYSEEIFDNNISNNKELQLLSLWCNYTD